MSQSVIGFGPLERARNLLLEVLRDLDAACEAERKNVVAPALDLSPSSLSNILAGRQRCSAEYLLALMEFDQGDYALKRMAARRGYQLKRIISSEEKLERIEEVMRRRLGPVAGEILSEALGEER